jgi:heme exporter protein CcmD
MQQFFEMGGYARFVWPSFAMGLAVFVWNIVAARRLHAQARARAQRLAEPGRAP